jgi:hypothetical protein
MKTNDNRHSNKKFKPIQIFTSGKDNLQVFILLIFIFILYGNTINNKFSLDDHLVAIDNHVIIKGFKAIPEILTSRYAANEGEMTYGYRPIVKLTFAVEYGLWGTNPYLSHLINIFLYSALCLLLILILRRILKDFNPFLPFLATLIFAAHPVHTEVVASLKNRDELLALIFSLGSVWFFLKYSELLRKRYIIAGLALFLMAYLSKPTSISFIFLIPLILYFSSSLKPGKLILIILGLISVFFIARYVPDLYLPKHFRPKEYYENNIRFEDFWTRVTTGFYILFFYLKKLVWPYPLLYYYGFNMIPIVKFNNPQVIISVIIHVTLFAYAIYKIREKSIYSFIILFYLISSAIFTNVVKPAMGIFAERFLITPSVAFSLFAGILILKTVN